MFFEIRKEAFAASVEMIHLTHATRQWRRLREASLTMATLRAERIHLQSLDLVAQRFYDERPLRVFRRIQMLVTVWYSSQAATLLAWRARERFQYQVL